MTDERNIGRVCAMEEHEERIVRRLVNDAIRLGYRLSVFDGEETTVNACTDATRVLAACGSTDEDRLTVQTADGARRIGTVLLVYGNEPGVVIAAYTDNPPMRELLAGAEALAEEIAEAH